MRLNSFIAAKAATIESGSYHDITVTTTYDVVFRLRLHRLLDTTLDYEVHKVSAAGGWELERSLRSLEGPPTSYSFSEVLGLNDLTLRSFTDTLDALLNGFLDHGLSEVRAAYCVPLTVAQLSGRQSIQICRGLGGVNVAII